MEKNNIIMQKWFHIYENFHDGKLNRKIKEVMDIYTLKDYICHDLSTIDFTNFQVTDYRNKVKLPFIHSNKKVRVLIDSNNWMKVPLKNCENNLEEYYYYYKHAKISISFNTKPYFKKNQKISTGYKTYFVTEYLPHPEFHINLQKGMKLNINSIDFIFCLKNHRTENNFRFNVKNNLLDVEKEINRNKYILSLNSQLFNKINSKKEFKELVLYYEVENQSKFLLMPFFMIFTWILSIMELISSQLLGFPFAMIITALIVYLNLIREGYEIPYNKLVIVLFFFSFISLLIKTINIFA